MFCNPLTSKWKRNVPSVIKFESKKISKKEEQELLKRKCSGDKQARDQLVLNNIETAEIVLSKYSCKPEDEEELYSCAMLGLVKGVEKAEPGRKTDLSCYLRWFISSAISDFLERNNVVKIPSDYLRKSSRSFYDGFEYEENKKISSIINSNNDEKDCDKDVFESGFLKIDVLEFMDKMLEKEKHAKQIKQRLIEKMGYREIGKSSGVSKQWVRLVCKRFLEKCKEKLEGYENGKYK